MSNHLYGYTSTAYGGGAGNSRSAADASLLAISSRYLAADQLSSSSSLSSSSLLYNPESYSRIPALPSTTSLNSYRPPGVDLAAAGVPTDPLYAGVKRTSAECKLSSLFLVLFFLPNWLIPSFIWLKWPSFR